MVYERPGSTTRPSGLGSPNGALRSIGSIWISERSLLSLVAARRQDLGQVIVSSGYPFQVGISQASCVLNFACLYGVEVANNQRDLAASRVRNGCGEHFGRVRIS